MPSSAEPVQVSPGVTRPKGWSRILDILLFVVVTLAAVFIFGLLSYSLYAQIRTYSSAIEHTKKTSGDSAFIILAYTRATDFAIVKTSVVFLGFITAFIGALYVLRAGGASFSLQGKVAGTEGSLHTASPGLVMVALGIITVNSALFARTTIGLEGVAGSSGPDVKLTQPPHSSSEDVLNEATKTTKFEQNKDGSFNLPPFPLGSAVLTKAQKDALTELAPRLKRSTAMFALEGQLDDLGPDAMAVQERRTFAIEAFLINLGVNARMIYVVGYGQSPREKIANSKLTPFNPKD